jgi:hypothetical protein
LLRRNEELERQLALEDANDINHVTRNPPNEPLSPLRGRSADIRTLPPPSPALPLTRSLNSIDSHRRSDSRASDRSASLFSLGPEGGPATRPGSHVSALSSSGGSLAGSARMPMSPILARVTDTLHRRSPSGGGSTMVPPAGRPVSAEVSALPPSASPPSPPQRPTQALTPQPSVSPPPPVVTPAPVPATDEAGPATPSPVRAGRVAALAAMFDGGRRQ